MATTKPQFKVYLGQKEYDEIQNYAVMNGLKLGVLIEKLWSFFMLKDLGTLADRIERYTKDHPFKAGESPVALVRIGIIINRWMKQE